MAAAAAMLAASERQQVRGKASSSGSHKQQQLPAQQEQQGHGPSGHTHEGAAWDGQSRGEHDHGCSERAWGEPGAATVGFQPWQARRCAAASKAMNRIGKTGEMGEELTASQKRCSRKAEVDRRGAGDGGVATAGRRRRR